MGKQIKMLEDHPDILAYSHNICLWLGDVFSLNCEFNSSC